MRLTGLVLSHLLVLVLLRRRLLDNPRLGLTFPLSLRRADRTAFAIVVALVALRQVLAKMALRGPKLQAATAIALWRRPRISKRVTNWSRATYHLVQIALLGHGAIRIRLRRYFSPTTLRLGRGLLANCRRHPPCAWPLALRLRLVIRVLLLGLRLLRDGRPLLRACHPRRSSGLLGLRGRLLFLRLRKHRDPPGQVRHLRTARPLARLLSAAFESRTEHQGDDFEVSRIRDVEAAFQLREDAIDLSVQELGLDARRHPLALHSSSVPILARLTGATYHGLGEEAQPLLVVQRFRGSLGREPPEVVEDARDWVGDGRTRDRRRSLGGGSSALRHGRVKKSKRRRTASVRGEW